MMSFLESLLGGAAPGKYQTTLDVDGKEGPLAIPVLVVVGDEPGPTSLVNGGTHGDEFDGPEAIRRFWHAISPRQVRGSVALIPALNLPAYLAAMRNNPADGVDMSGVWREGVADSTTSRIAKRLMESVLPHVSARLDMHGGGDIFKIARLVMFTRPNDDALRAKYLSLTKRIGIDMVWQFPTPTVEDNYFIRNGKVSIGVEIGGEARLDEVAVRDNLTALHNFLIAVGNLEGVPVLPRQWRLIEGRPDHSQRAGFLRSFVELGDRVFAGQRIGQIADVAGANVEEVLAVQDGIVTTIRTKPILPAGGATFQVSRVIEVLPNPNYEVQS